MTSLELHKRPKTYIMTQLFLAGDSVVTSEGRMPPPHWWLASTLEIRYDHPALETVQLQTSR